MFCFKYSEYLVHGLWLIINVMFYIKGLFDLSFPAQLTENISVRSKCHLDIKDDIFCGLPRQIRTLTHFETATSVDFLCIKMTNIHLSPHTRVEICSGNMLFDSNFHKSNFHHFYYNHPWIFFNDTVSSADVPVLAVVTAQRVQMFT